MQRFSAVLAFLSLFLPAVAELDIPAFHAAVELYNQRKAPEAQRAFEALATANPANANIQFYLGRLALQLNEHEKAAKHLEKAVELGPHDSRFHLRLGDAYGQLAKKAGMFSALRLAGKCRAAYEKAIELDPKSLDARFSLLGFYQQAPAIAGGGMDKAHAQAQEIKKLDANRGHQAIAGLYAVEKKYAEAFAELDAALTKTPGDYAALFQSGRLAAVSGERLERGLACLRQCLTQTTPEGQPGHAAAHWRIGNILEKQNDKTGARAAYEAALKLDPKFSQASESLKKL